MRSAHPSLCESDLISELRRADRISRAYLAGRDLAEPLRYPPGTQSHRPFPHDFCVPEVGEGLKLNGKGWASPELSELLRDFGHGLVRQACDELGCDPRRQNIAALREHLEKQEARLK